MKGLTLALAGVVALLAQVTGQEKSSSDGSEQKFSRWMDFKVEESQEVFASLARADFKAIAASAEKLKALNALERFVRRGVPGYGTQLRSFEFAVDEIQQQAKRENLEGVTMGFNQLTLSCVNCHKQLRRAAKEAPGAPAVDPPR
jgi:hypothetical protein